jgi:membrane-anchored protein YejM (alkaline phosphatase superfamily)
MLKIRTFSILILLLDLITKLWSCKKALIQIKYRVFLRYVRVLILTSEITRQFMKVFSITFCKIRKSIPRFFALQFLPNESFCVIFP